MNKTATLALALALALALGAPSLAFAQSAYERAGEAFDSGDPAATLRYLEQAVQEGDMRGALGLGQMHESGSGVSANAATAHGWYLKAADAGSAEAQYRVGAMARAGRGTARDVPRAIRYLKLSAEQGLLNAQSELAALYLMGEAGKNEAAGLQYLRLAADNGSAAAARMAGERLALANVMTPTPPSWRDEVRYLRQAADAGDAKAFINTAGALRRRYQFDEALRYYGLAASAGQDVAKAIADTRKEQAAHQPLPSSAGKYSACWIDAVNGRHLKRTNANEPFASAQYQASGEFITSPVFAMAEGIDIYLYARMFKGQVYGGGGPVLATTTCAPPGSQADAKAALAKQEREGPIKNAPLRRVPWPWQ